MKQPRPRSPIFSKILPLFLSILLLFFSIFLIFSPQKRFSPSENRALAQWPKPTLRTLADASFFSHLSRACSDQFPLRASFCALKARAERALGKRENNGILFGKDGYLIDKSEPSELTVLQENLRALQALRADASIPVTTLIVPRCVDVMRDVLPSGFVPDSAVYTQIEHASVADLLPTSILREAAQQQQVFYRTDHHWTAHGAYAAYAALAPLLGVVPYDESFFEQSLVSTTFYGTSDAAVGGIAEQSDSIVLYRYQADLSFRRTDLQTGQSSVGFYDLSALAERDQYRVFLGGNTALLSIEPTKSQSARPRLLLIKDSFANSLVPFLALHFDLTLLDPRYDGPSLRSLLAEQQFDRILIVQGIGTLCSDRSLSVKLPFTQARKD